jgi:hypothetical protein
MLGLGMMMIVIFRYTQRIVRPMSSFQAVNIVKKCRHLSDFLAVTLQHSASSGYKT